MRAKQTRFTIITGLVLLLAAMIFMLNNNTLPQTPKQKKTSGVKPPSYITNTPYYKQTEKEDEEDEEREERADKDMSRWVGNAMHVAIKDHDDTEQYGYAEIAEGKKGLTISIHTENSEPPLEVNQPTILFHGTCKERGEIYQALTPVRDGRSDTTVELSMFAVKKQLPLALYIFRDEGSLHEYNSCGDLPLQ